MPRNLSDSDTDELLEDLTASLTLRSKRTSRLQKRKAAKDYRQSQKASLTNLPTEILLEILELSRPSDVLRFAAVNHRFRNLVLENANAIGEKIVKTRYTLLAKCFPLPVLLEHVDPAVRLYVCEEQRVKQLNVSGKYYQHVRPMDHRLLCSCLTCHMSWNNLSLVLDFAHFQLNLDNGQPIPVLPRGRVVQWNQDLVDKHARMALKAIYCPLSYAHLLEIHLASTIKAIRRQAKNKGNKRKHVPMTEEDLASGTDLFLAKDGPLSLEFPFNRDQYHLLEAYMPNRWWKKHESRWIYTVEGMHQRDLDRLVMMATRDVASSLPVRLLPAK